MNSLIVFLLFLAARGFEAVNIKITDRNIKSISQLPKIPKKKKTDGEDQGELSVGVYKSAL